MRKHFLRLTTTKAVVITCLGLTCICLVLVVLIPRKTHAPQQGQGVCVPKSLQPTDSNCIYLTRLETPGELARGLSGRESLAPDAGMLFVFDRADVQCMWMKDMRFPIDIVWLNEDKTIVAKRENVSPDTYPESYCPDTAAKYVVEVNAGIARQWQTGQTIPF